MITIARFEPNHAGIKAWARSNDMRDGLNQLAEPIQDDAARINSTDAVDTGLMTASWRIEPILTASGWMVRIHNTAESEDGFKYPLVIEFGRTTENGRHIEGLRILGRALANNSR